MSHWCEFCGLWHSSASCYHPANKPKEKVYYGSCSGCAAKDEEIEKLKEREEAAEQLCKIYFEIAENIPYITYLISVRGLE